MSRQTSAPTAAAPYLASWTAADYDLTSVAANSPILVGDAANHDTTVIRPVLACDAAGGSVTAFLSLVGDLGLVVWHQEITFGGSNRRMALDNGSGLYLMEANGDYWAFETRGVKVGQPSRLHFGIASIATATQVALVAFQAPAVV